MAEALRLGRDRMLEPQDLPGRFGRVIKAIDRVLAAAGIQAVLAGGWAVWRHGYDGRMTNDVDVAIAADRVTEFMQMAAVSGFQVLNVGAGQWPKLIHKDTGIQVDILAEGARPGMSTRPAPTTIPSPQLMGARGSALTYIRLESLVELKLAAARPKDEADVIELIRANPERWTEIRAHLETIHNSYVEAFDRLQALANDPKI
ncbi:MAG: hypothetical protein ACJ8C4_18950 [Gemmataceae bacterium]